MVDESHTLADRALRDILECIRHDAAAARQGKVSFSPASRASEPAGASDRANRRLIVPLPVCAR
jgi:hypothetical protein